jgi:hypothetical protein
MLLFLYCNNNWKYIILFFYLYMVVLLLIWTIWRVYVNFSINDISQDTTPYTVQLNKTEHRHYLQFLNYL